MREIELVDPLPLIARRQLSADAATMSRQGIGSQRVPAWLPMFCLFVLPDNTKRLWFFFFSSKPSFYTVTHFPIRAFANSTNGWTSSVLHLPFFVSCSGHPRRYPAEFTAVLLHRFIAARETFCFRAASRCCFPFVSENCMRFPPTKNGSRTRAQKADSISSESSHNRAQSVRWYTDTIDRIIRASRN